MDGDGREDSRIDGGATPPPDAAADGRRPEAWVDLDDLTSAPEPGGTIARRPTVRILTIVLMVVLVLVAVLGGLGPRPRQVRQVAQTLPPVEKI